MNQRKKILVVGYGSMGRRRIRLVSELLYEVEFICVDSNLKRRMQAKKAGIEVYSNLEEGIKKKPDIAFVCTSPGHHAEIILRLIDAGINIFTELNLTSDKYDIISIEAKKKGVTVFVSSTLLYKRQMEIFDRLVKTQKKPVTYIYHVGQYLPDWHPWENYKDFFAGKKSTNGVREILAIQIPWIIQTFGKIGSVNAIHQKCTELEIDFPDSIVMSIEHENSNIGTFVADVVSRKATTRLEIINEDLYVSWGGHNEDLYLLNMKTKELEQVQIYESTEHVEGYSDNIEERPYREEIKAFFNVINGERARYTLEDDEYVLSLIDKIEGIKGN